MNRRNFIISCCAVTLSACDVSGSLSQSGGGQDVPIDPENPSGDCPSIVGQPIRFKPVSEGDGNLVVLTKTSGDVWIQTNEGKFEQGTDFGSSNGYAHTVRFDMPGSAYPNGCVLKIGDTTFLVPDTSTNYG